MSDWCRRCGAAPGDECGYAPCGAMRPVDDDEVDAADEAMPMVSAEVYALVLGECQKERDAAEAAAREALGALKPLGDLAGEVDELNHADDSTCLWRLRAGDIRAARETLLRRASFSGEEGTEG